MIFIKGYIYKITNRLNGKVYIGFTSRTTKERFMEHKRFSRYLNKKFKDDKSKIEYLYRAMNKYGEDNFSVETIYKIEDGEDEVLLEQYFIALYNSQNQEIGYNMDIGGGKPPTLYGENNPLTKLSDEDVVKIVDDLKNSSLSLSKIARKFDVHEGTVYRINIGETRHSSKEIYPLRMFNPLDERAKQIIEDLLHTELMIKEIAEKYEMHYQNISDINNGKTFKHITKDMSFPLRKERGRLGCSIEVQRCVTQDIEQGVSISEISRRYKINRSTVYTIKKRNSL